MYLFFLSFAFICKKVFDFRLMGFIFCDVGISVHANILKLLVNVIEYIRVFLKVLNLHCVHLLRLIKEKHTTFDQYSKKQIIHWKHIILTVVNTNTQEFFRNSVYCSLVQDYRIIIIIINLYLSRHQKLQALVLCTNLNRERCLK